MKLNWNEYYNKVHGGWLGRCIGSQLGAPLEFRPFFLISSKYAGLNNYIKEITGEEVNDDEMYEIVALLTFERHGIDFSAEQLAMNWVEKLYSQNFTAERVALRNLRRKKLLPPESATYKNPYYDFIGAQMRADIYGLVCPGCPEAATRYAELDASVSHAGEGVYGEVFVAGIIALSFFKRDLKEIMQQVLQNYIPSESMYYAMVENCMKWAVKYADWKDAREEMLRLWEEMRTQLREQSTSINRKIILKGSKIHEVHVLPNAGIITLGLLYGNGDFEKTICTTALMGLDTDCNVGNVGTIMGVQFGAKEIPSKWKDPLNNTFKTAVKGFSETRISAIAERIARIGRQVVSGKCQNIQLGEN
ncbi:MAG: ADP-ribosylglycohydrolase family protein [Promethearchaeota archaeon]|nr:MAG: ADP-ribosylglycohydrolase family protein [Candidatus Lokiarchaeota archaeon]